MPQGLKNKIKVAKQKQKDEDLRRPQKKGIKAKIPPKKGPLLRKMKAFEKVSKAINKSIELEMIERAEKEKKGLLSSIVKNTKDMKSTKPQTGRKRKILQNQAQKVK